MHLDVVVSQVYWALIVSIPWCWFFFYYLFALVDEKRASNIYTKTYQD